LLNNNLTKQPVKIELVNKDSAEEIAKLAVCLTDEIIERTGLQAFDVDVPLATKLCKNYIENGQYNIIAAFDDEKIIGFGSLCESFSLYAEGAFGIIQEFYISPEYRSQKIGQKLIQQIIEFAKEKEWKRLELCTPPIPAFKRSVDFYKENGFETTGGYKMKRTINQL
jgi:GNAT superfamily N-acetyltransferase